MKRSIIYCLTTSEISGGNKVLQRIMEGVRSFGFHPIAVIPRRGPVESELSHAKVDYRVIDTLGFGRSILSRLFQLLRFRALVISSKPVLLHSNELPYRFASIATDRIPKVLHIHHPGFTEQTLAWILKKPPRVIVTPSRYIYEEVISKAGDRERRIDVLPIYNPIDTDWFSPRNKVTTRGDLGLTNDRFHLSILGTVAPHKGHEIAIRSLELVCKRYPTTTLHVVGALKPGRSDYLSHLKKVVAELKMGGNVRFWGGVSDSEARDLLSASDVFVLPSSEEGFGLVVAESQACEVPVVATRMRPLDEVLIDGETGFLAEGGNPNDFARYILHLLDNENARREFGKRGRTFVTGVFSQVKYVERIAKLYVGMLQS